MNMRRSAFKGLVYMSAAIFTLLLIFSSNVGFSGAAPVTVPDFRQCSLAQDSSVSGPAVHLSFNCCLPVVPTKDKPMKVFSLRDYARKKYVVRRPAHLVSEDYIAKYNLAYKRMRELPASDPRSMAAQANLHCAFCNGAYLQAGTDVTLQVHFSWLFLPWHRMYLYFHERILGSLINDPSFALVFWNWDDQSGKGGNVLPEMFARQGTALYDEKRDPKHAPPALVRLSPRNNSTNDSVILAENLNLMYQTVVTANTAELFAGGPYRVGTDVTNSSVLNAPLAGSLEASPHNGMHYWTGDRSQPLGQDMGTFSTASRDPVFYAHHSNVDRLWQVWRYNLPGGQRRDHTDPDFLNAEFVFYDENSNLVKVKVRDALDSSKLGVRYASVAATDNLWINYSPPVTSSASSSAASVQTLSEIATDSVTDLGSKLTLLIPRNASTTKDEVLVMEGLQLERNSFVQLLVFINLPDAGPDTSINGAEYVGTYNIVPALGKHRHLLSNVKFEIGDNIKRIGLQEQSKVVITVVVKGDEKVSIQGMKIISN